jgi:hypothetical protein
MITVITVVKDDVLGFHETIKSLKSQTADFSHFTIDGSNCLDNQTRIQALCIDVPSTYNFQEPKGIYSAMNYSLVGIPNSTWVLFLNAGDVFESPESVAQIKRDIQIRNPKWIIYACRFGQANNFIHTVSDPSLGALVGGKSRICHQSVVMPIDLIRQYKNFDESYTVAADYKLFLQVRKDHSPMLSDFVLSRVETGGISDQSCWQVVNEYHRARKETHLLVDNKILLVFQILINFVRCKVKIYSRWTLKKIGINPLLVQTRWHR